MMTTTETTAVDLRTLPALTRKEAAELICGPVPIRYRVTSLPRTS